jgi:hypothetical protein
MLRIAGGILISFFAIQILKFVVGFCLGYRDAMAGKAGERFKFGPAWWW